MKNKKLPRVLIAPNAFKESLTAYEAAKAIQKGILCVNPDIKTTLVPIADGGDGTMDVLVRGLGGKQKTTTVMGPMDEVVNAKWGIINRGKSAVIEMAQASGLFRVPINQRNPLKAHTYGTGELIKKCLDSNVSEIVVGVGGSATVDMGTGALMALGMKFLDKKGKAVGLGGGNLTQIVSIDDSNLDRRINEVKIRVACDVKNPLLGKDGAVSRYAPQKGATPVMLTQLEEGFFHFNELIQRTLGINLSKVPGAGAAGGLGAGLMAFINAELVSGSDYIMNELNIDEALKNNELVVTGEGKIDSQSRSGKAPSALAFRAQKYHCKVIALAGIIGNNRQALHNDGFTALFPIQNGPMSMTESIAESSQLLARQTEEIFRLIINI